MSFKIWFLALVLSMAMAISGIASGADSIGKNSISFNTASWCATPVFTTPSYTDIMPEIRIIGSHSNTATSWSINIATIFKFPSSSNAGASAMTVVPVTASPPDESTIITSSPDIDALNTLSSSAHAIDITLADPTDTNSDGTVLMLDADSVTIDTLPDESDARIPESNEISITLENSEKPILIDNFK